MNNPMFRDMNASRANAIWAHAVASEMEAEVEAEQESADRMAGHVCSACGFVFPGGDRSVICWHEEMEMGEDV